MRSVPANRSPLFKSQIMMCLTLQVRFQRVRPVLQAPLVSKLALASSLLFIKYHLNLRVNQQKLKFEVLWHSIQYFKPFVQALLHVLVPK